MNNSSTPKKDQEMTQEQVIKQRGIDRGANQVGIASVEDINRYAPSGHRPDDILLEAKSVIVFAGITTPNGAWHSPDSDTHYRNRDFPRIRFFRRECSKG